LVAAALWGRQSCGEPLLGVSFVILETQRLLGGGKAFQTHPSYFTPNFQIVPPEKSVLGIAVGADVLSCKTDAAIQQ